GIDLAKKIRERDILSPIVFLTSYKEYMEEVFHVQTFDYLLKPPTEDRLHQVLEKLRQQLEKKRNYFVFSSNKVTYKIPTKDIIYFEKDKRQVLIHTVGEIYKPYMSTNQINEQLDTNFVQVHSSFIINCVYIKELGKNFLLMDSKEKCIEIPISRRFKAAAHKSIVMSMRGKI
ncbi:response regulator transcription factor, partial [Enterococcus faecalis]|nr:response regulator transcription factor [Enterococcus faecalis]